MGSEAYDFLQGQGGMYGRIMDDYYRRLNARPKTPATPTLTADTILQTDGGTTAQITVDYSPHRKDMDYMLSWKKSTESSPTYERIRKFPHIIRPVDTGATFEVDLSVERRQTGARSPFGTVTSVAVPDDPNAPAAPTGLSCSTNAYTGTITLQWNPNIEDDLIYYRIYRGTSSGTYNELALSVGTTYDDFNATTGTTYCYAIKAIDRSNNASAFSNETSCTVRFLGTISVIPQKTSIQDPPASFGTVYTQSVTIPAGTVQMTGPVMVRSNTITGGPDSVSVRVVLTIGAFTATSTTATFNFTSSQSGEERTSPVTIASVTASGVGTLAYQWQNTTGSSHQLTAPAAWIAE